LLPDILLGIERDRNGGGRWVENCKITEETREKAKKMGWTAETGR